ncbi:MAG TPA: c-type cytochrome [Gallionellaceae bacterium]|nr:c-type cytochrome [Gallionellaceae bacterium]
METRTGVRLGIVAGLMMAGSAMAVDMPPLAQQSGCTACHAIDQKIVGPAWMDVAKKYRGVKGAEAKLVAKVKNGGSGVWGEVPMPPQPAPVANVKKLVKFILSLK